MAKNAKKPKKKIPAKALKKTSAPPRPAKKDVKTYTVIAPTAFLLADPSDEIVIGDRDSQLLFGESFKVEGKKGAWLYGVSVVDGYAGYVRESDLRPEKEKPGYVVEKALAHVYPRPDFKTRPVMTLSFMSRVSVEAGTPKNGFVKMPGYGWIYKNHLKKISELSHNMDPLAAALKFIGSPYLYGGRSATGVDCSGLVQLALSYCAVPCPRDSADQIGVGKPVSIESMQRGDLVFFKGHVGFLIDRSHVLNATSRSMDVRIERLEELAGLYKGVIAVKRVKT